MRNKNVWYHVSLMTFVDAVPVNQRSFSTPVESDFEMENNY